MKRLLAFCLPLLACTQAQPMPVRNVSTQAPAPTAALALPPIVLDNPDSPSRYHLPVPGDRLRMPDIPLDEFRLSNGIRVLLWPRTEVPLVSIQIVMRWKGPAPVHQMALQEVLLDGIPKQGQSLRKSLADLKITIQGDSSQSYGQAFGFSVPSARLETSLSVLFNSLSRPMTSVQNADLLRGSLKFHVDRSMFALWINVDETPFPAGHPYHDQVRPPEHSSLKFDDAVRFRDAELRPETITICAVGNVSRETLQPMLERVAMGFAATPAPPERKKPALPPYSGGVFLHQTTPDDAAGVVVIPAPPLGDADMAAFNLVSRLLRQVMESGRRQERVEAEFSLRFYPGEAYLAMVVPGDSARVSELGHEVVAAMKRVAAGDFAPTMLEKARSEAALVVVERLESFPYAAETLAESVMVGAPADAAVKVHNGALDLSRDAVIAAAQKWLKTNAIRIVATGDVSTLKNGLSDLDIRPVTVVSPKVDAGKRKK